MSRQCKDCLFSKNIKPPVGDKPQSPPGPVKRRFLWFSWQERPHYFDILGAQVKLDIWQNAMDKHESKVICTRYPKTEVKRKTDSCGEFAANAIVLDLR